VPWRLGEAKSISILNSTSIASSKDIVESESNLLTNRISTSSLEAESGAISCLSKRCLILRNISR